MSTWYVNGWVGADDPSSVVTAYANASSELEQRSGALRIILQRVNEVARQSPSGPPAGWRGIAQSSYGDALHRLRRAILSAQDEVELAISETERAIAELHQRSG
ncbi:MAG: hypothetical protein H7248_10285 [Microbacteriaceae bacterium]|nr:hypothetical protein [Microbacteriaceae bacterium]